MPRKLDHLRFHGGTWQVRVDLPKDVRPIIGKTCLIQSLGTASLDEANRLKGAIITRFRSMISYARNPSPSLEAKVKQLRSQLEASRDDLEEMDAHMQAASASSQVEETHGAEEGERFFRAALGFSTPLEFRLEEWMDDQGFIGKTKLQHRKAFAVLKEWCASRRIEPTLQAIDHRTALRFRDECLRKRLGVPKTINRYLSSYRTHWKWALAREIGISANPWSGTSDDGRWLRASGRHGGDDDEKRPFTDEEVTALLEGDAPHPLPDLLRMALLTGARINAICELRVGDCVDGNLVFGRAKREKRGREVPIHSDLKAVIARRIEGKRHSEFLFHELPDATPTRPRSAPASQAFTRYRREVGVDDPGSGKRQSNVDFHSARRWFIKKARDALERGAKGFTPWTIADVVGHDTKEMPLPMTMGLYPGPSELKARRACVEAVKLPTKVRNAASPRPMPARLKRVIKGRSRRSGGGAGRK